MIRSILIFLSALLTASLSAASDRDAQTIVRDSFNHIRGLASTSTVEMTIHRPAWERKMTIQGWTKGERKSIFRILKPAKDRGNGTLKKGVEMWTYNPKVNRVIKLPPSMMSQAWMGSDFSNNDLAKSDSILNDYIHELEGTATHEGKKVYLIKSTPKPSAPVVWGLQRMRIREDNILLSQTFYDEDIKPVKEMTCKEIQMLGGRLLPRIMTMKKEGHEDEYTALVYEKIEFLDSLSDALFSVSELKSFRR